MKNNLTRISRVQATTPSLGAAGKKSQQDLTVTQDTNERILPLRSQCEKRRREQKGRAKMSRHKDEDEVKN